jgi:membrane associated rhomboid family serine protease
MADWKIIGLSGLFNAALTITLIMIFFPLFFLGPLTGGFLASYFSRGYEDYDKMDLKDGTIVGAISGIIGGLIITLLLIIGFKAINTITNLISLRIGIIPSANTLVAAYIVLQLSIIISTILGAIGGLIGIKVKK